MYKSSGHKARFITLIILTSKMTDILIVRHKKDLNSGRSVEHAEGVPGTRAPIGPNSFIFM